MPHQKRIMLYGLLILWLGLVTSAGLRAAGPVKDVATWDNLQELTWGQEIQVVLNDAKSFRGKFESATGDTLLVRLARGELSFDRQSILRVSAKRGRSHRLRNLAYGAVIGMAAGAITGVAIGLRKVPHSGLVTWGTPEQYHAMSVNTGVGTAVGLGAGAAVGAALPTGGWREVYRAR